MKSKFIQFLLVLLLLEMIAYNDVTPYSSKPTRLELFVDSFDKANPKYYNYDSTEERGDSLLKSSFFSGCQNRNLLDDFPFILHDVGKSVRGQFYGHFEAPISIRPDWQFSLDFIVPVSEEEHQKLVLKKTYRLKGIRNMIPVTEAWKYNVDFPSGTHRYYITENNRAKVIELGTNYADAQVNKE